MYVSVVETCYVDTDVYTLSLLKINAADSESMFLFLLCSCRTRVRNICGQHLQSSKQKLLNIGAKLDIPVFVFTDSASLECGRLTCD